MINRKLFENTHNSVYLVVYIYNVYTVNNKHTVDESLRGTVYPANKNTNTVRMLYVFAYTTHIYV